MNKSVLSLALASMLVSASASAVTVLEKDNFTWNLSGDFQVQLRQKAGEDQDLYVDYDDAELKNGFVYDLGNGMKAFAQADYDIKKEASEEVYVGLQFNDFKVILGDTDLPSESYGHEVEYEGSSFEDAFAATKSDDQLRVEYDFGKSSVAVSTDVSDESDNTSIDVNFVTQFSGFDLGLAYQSYTEEEGVESVDTLGVAFGGSVGKFAYGVDYSENDDLDVLHFSTLFEVASSTKLGLGYEMATEKDVDIDSWYMNATKKLNGKVSVLAEIHNSDKDNSEAGFLVGMRVKF